MIAALHKTIANRPYSLALPFFVQTKPIESSERTENEGPLRDVGTQRRTKTTATINGNRSHGRR
jgi:hypothetical protein